MNNLKRYAAIAAAVIAFAGFSGGIARADGETTTTTTNEDFTAVLVTVKADTPIYYAPGQQITTDDHLAAGQQFYVVGVDSTGKYARVYVTESFYTWVPVSSLALGSTAGFPVISD